MATELANHYGKGTGIAHALEVARLKPLEFQVFWDTNRPEWGQFQPSASQATWMRAREQTTLARVKGEMRQKGFKGLNEAMSKVPGVPSPRMPGRPLAQGQGKGSSSSSLAGISFGVPSSKSFGGGSGPGDASGFGGKK